MSSSIYVFDPTANDKLSRTRGVGRYLQILKENFAHEFNFINNLNLLTTLRLRPPLARLRSGQAHYQLSTIFINPFFNFLQPPLLMKKIAQKQIAIIHDLIPLKYPDHFPVGIKGKLNVFLNKLALKNYDFIITDSEASKKDIVYILKINENKIKVIYPTLPDIFNQQNNTTHYSLPTTNYCLYAGDATWNKNLVNLAKAIKIINVPCVFVGKVFDVAHNIQGSKIPVLSDLGGAQRMIMSEHAHGDEKHGIENLNEKSVRLSHPWQKEFKQFLEETKDDKRFVFAGFIPDEELIKLYQQARANILTSRAEGFGFSYLEAASQSCPSVLSDIPVFHEIAKDTALFANPDSPHDLADKIGELYFNADLKKEFGIKSYQRSAFFNQQTFKKEFKSLIDKISRPG